MDVRRRQRSLNAVGDAFRNVWKLLALVAEGVLDLREAQFDGIILGRVWRSVHWAKSGRKRDVLVDAGIVQEHSCGTISIQHTGDKLLKFYSGDGALVDLIAICAI